LSKLLAAASLRVRDLNNRWPDGSSGITSSKAMDDAEAAGGAIEVGSNFFLFFRFAAVQ